MDPLRDAECLQQIFSYVPGRWLFVGAVCKVWEVVYASMAEQQLLKLSLDSDDGDYALVSCGPKVTLYSAAVASPATVRLAGACGLRKHAQLQVIAGLRADVQTLAVLQELGMGHHDMLLQAVALSGRLEVLQHLVRERQCRKLTMLSHYAARSGSISMLNWLRTQSCCVFDASTCAGAARGGRLDALKHLRGEGCDWCEQDIAYWAARSGNIEVVEWLRQQQGIRFGATALAAAAYAGHIPMCAHLRSIGCDWDANTCYHAVLCNHIETLRWLRDNGCAWDLKRVCMCAAVNGFTNILEYILEYILEQGEVLDAQLLAIAMNHAGCGGQLQAAQWLRQHGARWPDLLGYDEHDRWSDGMIAWARAEGCTAPIATTLADNDDDDEVW
jgi:Ankyrin repeats (3 copies)